MKCTFCIAELPEPYFLVFCLCIEFSYVVKRCLRLRCLSFIYLPVRYFCKFKPFDKCYFAFPRKFFFLTDWVTVVIRICLYLVFSPQVYRYFTKIKIALTSKTTSIKNRQSFFNITAPKKIVDITTLESTCKKPTEPFK